MIKKMLQQMQIMYWEAGRLLIWLSLVGIAAAICPPESCGSLNLSYPFWIHNTNCGYPGFQTKCKENTAAQLAPFLPGFVEHNIGDMDNDFEILEIDYNGSLIINSTSLKAMSCNRTDDAFVHFMLPVDGPFTISSVNKFVVIGCNSLGSFKVDTDPQTEGSCTSACLNQYDPEYCNTYGCCEAGIPGNKRMINFTGGGISYQYFTGCGFSTVLDPVTWSLPQNQGGFFASGHYGVRLDWSIGRSNCTAAKGTSNYSCAEQAECIDQATGHVCKCLPGYEGNGYSNGTDCTNIDECIHTDLNVCVVASEGGICTDLPGSYNCSCSKGYSGDGFQNGTRCQPLSSDNSVRSAIIGSVSSFIGVSMGACGLFWWLKRRRLKQERDNNFLLNGGIQLQEHIASMGGRKTLRIFSEKELEIASNNYSSELGRGGFATVYKGVLLDGTQVAIKKPKAISPEFHNEVMIFSHINHRNTVKMLGCCLQTQFPLLVYEFVSNGTLYQHLHSMDKHLPWETRRQIAIETADAIAYMHHQASQPIFHRDIKSSNILLDDTFTPKVADFGISRLRPSDEPHLNTMAAGTPGYLDPEFIRSDQYTDKSDVFSFGVVLVELLTGLKTLLSDQQGIVHTLYDHFLSAINQNRLTEILDSSVVNEENQAQMKNMSRLAQACLREKGRERPSMREVVEELAWIRAATKHTGHYSDVSLVEHRGDSTQAKMNDYTLVAVGESKFEDPYAWPGHTQITTSEDPSTSLIEMRWSDMYAR